MKGRQDLHYSIERAIFSRFIVLSIVVTRIVNRPMSPRILPNAPRQATRDKSVVISCTTKH